MKIGRGDFWHGDCLDLMPLIPDGSVDMILCDLPYGTTQNKWDAVIPFEPLWKEYWRVAKPNAAIVLTAAQPFTSALVMSQVKHFKYDWAWAKNKGTGALNAKKQPLRAHESIAVFYRKQSEYFPQLTKGHKPVSYNRGQSASPNYGAQTVTRYEGGTTRLPKSVLEFPIVNNDSPEKWHPTQKPVALFEYLIKTYTRPGELVLDNCAGSGTTAIAAENTSRRWLCIEQDQTYYDAAVQRVLSHEVDPFA